MLLKDRLQWIEGMLRSENQAVRRLGARVVASTTSVPQTLSGYSPDPRKLGADPHVYLWGDVHDYLTRLTDIRFGLLDDPDPIVRRLAEKDMIKSVQQMSRDLPPENVVQILERLSNWQFKNIAQANVADNETDTVVDR